MAKRKRKRKRKHIPAEQRLAATLAMLLPREQRDEMRARRARAKEVIGRFDFDHTILHTWAGSDAWHNLTPMLKLNHVAKTRVDIGRVAKVSRLGKGWHEFMRAVAAGKKPRPRPSRWPKRKVRA